MVIDADYRGEIIVALHNDSDEDQIVPIGSRIAQLIILPYQNLDFFVVDELNKTERNENGFGSSGIK